MSKDYDTEIIDGTVSIVRAGFKTAKTSENLSQKGLGTRRRKRKQKHKFKPLRGEDGAFLIQDPSRELLIPLVQSERCCVGERIKRRQLDGWMMNAAKRAHGSLKKARTHAKEFKDACTLGDAKLVRKRSVRSYILGVTDLNDGAKKIVAVAQGVNTSQENLPVLGKVGPTEIR